MREGREAVERDRLGQSVWWLGEGAVQGPWGRALR